LAIGERAAEMIAEEAGWKRPDIVLKASL